jgi:hypothetical protein
MFSPKIIGGKMAILTKITAINAETISTTVQCQFFRRKFGRIDENSDHNIGPLTRARGVQFYKTVLVDGSLGIDSYPS